MSYLCVIPARGGSKRIPRKNIRDFAGKPMIAHSIEAALKSDCFEKVIVSTDDEEIAGISTKFGAEVPFHRPNELADDHSGTIPVIAHAISKMQKLGFDADYTCCLYATAPFITPEDIKNSLLKLKKSNSLYCFSVTGYGFPIQRSILLDQFDKVSMLYPEYEQTRSQDLESTWHDAGQFYWGRSQAWLDEEKLFAAHSLGFYLPRYRVQDIDTIEDWERATWLYKAMRLQEVEN